MAPTPFDIPDPVMAKLRALRDEHRQVEASLSDPAVFGDQQKLRRVQQRERALKKVAADVDRLEALAAEAAGCEAIVAANQERELVEMARADLERLRAEAAAVHGRAVAGLVQTDEDATESVMLEVRAGTGGDEAALWAGDLLDMYRKYAARRGWAFDVLDLAPGEMGGVRNATVNMRGPDVWRAMNFEAGVHSVKRVPATEAQGRVHTSTATVAVLAEPEEVSVKIDWANDVEEFATTSQGPGGQNVNKVATAVQIKHKPSGIIIRMMESKSQQQNRERARRLLTTKLHEIERQRVHSQRAAARSAQIGGGDRSEKIRTYRFKEGIVADERLPDEYPLRDLQGGDFAELHEALIRLETARRLAAI